jgi:hypothetical protein
MTRDRMTDLLPQGRFIVLCGRQDDALQWRDLLGPDRCLALPLDIPPLFPTRPLTGASAHLAWHHKLIADLDEPGWLTEQADSFDPRRQATLLFVDPLDPRRAGARRRFGGRSPLMRVLENKAINDSVWDAIGMPRARSVVADPPADLTQLGALVDEGAGVVCAIQPTNGSPLAGGDGIYWWRDRSPAYLDVGTNQFRVKLMPLLAGLPARIHGLVTAHDTIAFPPLEIIAPTRPDRGTFLCAGAVPTLGGDEELLSTTERAGSALQRVLGYHGAFSIDGILTPAGFRPTDLNARLTSAMEGASCALRIRLQLANLLAREGVELDSEAAWTLAHEAFNEQQTYTLYGLAGRANDRPHDVAVCWRGERLMVAYDDQTQGRLAITSTPRGWLLTAALHRDHVPTGPLNRLAGQVFELSDAVLGTDFGVLAVPEGVPAKLGTRDFSAAPRR